MIKHKNIYDDIEDDEENRAYHRDSIEWRFIGILWVIDVIGFAVVLNLIL